MTQSTGFFMAALFVGCTTVLGIFTLFVRAENIEREMLVGGLTILTSLIAIAVLLQDSHAALAYGGLALFGVCLLAVSGYAAGRVIDLLMGPKTHTRDQREATLGADLSD